MRVRGYSAHRLDLNRAWVFAALLAANFLTSTCRADDGIWSETLYAGPATNRFALHLFLHGNPDIDGAMVGLASDFKLAKLPWGLTLEGEGQLTQYTLGHNYETVALGVGLRFHNFPWSDRRPASFAIYTGPSYATNPPASGFDFDNRLVGFQRKHLLNYLSIEYAMALSRASPWDITFRAYHRSGVFGVYTPAADEGTMFGFGIRRRW